MAHYVIFTKVVTLLTFIRFQKKKIWTCTRIHHQKSGRSDQWCGLYDREQTDKQTNKQTDRQTDRQTTVTNILCKNLRFCKVTNRGDQYTLQKSTILQSNERIIGDFTFYTDFDWPWPLTLNPWPWPSFIFVRKNCKNLILWRHVTQNGASYIWMEITLR